ncbi:molybdate ABC transporter substrate-binding protein [Vibrio penaeicida]|uniref:molybdate ABC transporter substrate-binding protein n=1 Tax=Vibrio penaeicida TaxID=104609 RepID=UPI002733DA8B|nr:molybdate ABC transporter substrate-binding protein [Vibrio penaeicida]MDP2571822.1 molybdate ABC transporter substrate-binding protein [Vibrio penaeicida]
MKKRVFKLQAFESSVFGRIATLAFSSALVISNAVVLSSALAFSSAHAQENIRIYAASSMTNAVEEIVEKFEKSHNYNVIPVFGSSSSLARQIHSGAPADVYISANSKWADYLESQGNIKKENIANLASNTLVLISSPDKNIQFDVTKANEWARLLKNERMAIAQPDAVPAGIYAKEALTSLGVWDSVKKRTAHMKNVRATLAFVDVGESPLGIVYKTDAIASGKVNISHEFDAALHSNITYPLVNVSETDSAAVLTEYLKSETAQGILKKHGFKVIK